MPPALGHPEVLPPALGHPEVLPPALDSPGVLQIHLLRLLLGSHAFFVPIRANSPTSWAQTVALGGDWQCKPPDAILARLDFEALPGCLGRACFRIVSEQISQEILARLDINNVIKVPQTTNGRNNKSLLPFLISDQVSIRFFYQQFTTTLSLPVNSIVLFSPPAFIRTTLQGLVASTVMV